MRPLRRSVPGAGTVTVYSIEFVGGPRDGELLEVYERPEVGTEVIPGYVLLGGWDTGREPSDDPLEPVLVHRGSAFWSIELETLARSANPDKVSVGLVVVAAAVWSTSTALAVIVLLFVGRFLEWAVRELGGVHILFLVVAVAGIIAIGTLGLVNPRLFDEEAP